MFFAVSLTAFTISVTPLESSNEEMTEPLFEDGGSANMKGGVIRVSMPGTLFFDEIGSVIAGL